ncbi:hypothetical protein GCM10010358_23890 [Streptomyces minutiscleroticus]|uniref:Uncharacterized protein n=1 Tax=Streptomyces minutiscleroticus TaxID=68238 RepID=A0A918KPX3_9ACTN|nr:hypothetical protein [Streptomyces minutiscleroticus]GGX68776.1 hypothetical protein GCM10010358_23890 [Streptomyces minutiscleroticus]
MGEPVPLLAVAAVEGDPAALEAEVDRYAADPAAEKDENDRRLVVRSGHHQPRTAATAADPSRPPPRA